MQRGRNDIIHQPLSSEKEVAEAQAADKLPRRFRLTDESAPLPSPADLYPGDAIIFRHYRHPQRAALAAGLRAACRGIVFLLAGDEAMAERLGADGIHLPRWWRGDVAALRQRHPGWRITMSVHDAGELARAVRSRPDAVLVSPVFATPSHPEAAPLGPEGLAALTEGHGLPVYALGGVNEARFRELQSIKIKGYAGIRLSAE